MSVPVTFQYHNKVYTVDEDNQPGIWRLNAMTWYQALFPFILIAREVRNIQDVENGRELFFMIFTREEKWVSVDLNTGRNVINIINNRIP